MRRDAAQSFGPSGARRQNRPPLYLLFRPTFGPIRSFSPLSSYSRPLARTESFFSLVCGDSASFVTQHPAANDTPFCCVRRGSHRNSRSNHSMFLANWHPPPELIEVTVSPKGSAQVTGTAPPGEPCLRLLHSPDTLIVTPPSAWRVIQWEQGRYAIPAFCLYLHCRPYFRLSVAFL